MKNRSQLSDLRIPENLEFNKKVGRIHSNMQGIETPLGHSYSLVLEAIAEQGLDATPKPNEFLDFIRERLTRSGREEATFVSMMSPSYFNIEARAIDEYMEQKSLRQEHRDRVMREILGCTLKEVY